MSDSPKLDQLAADLEDLRRAVRRLTSPQLPNSATRGVRIVDEDGNTRQIIGTLPDGTTGQIDIPSDPPPQPGSPIVKSVPGSLVVEWDGSWVDVEAGPLDLDRVDIILAPQGSEDPMAIAPAAAIVASRGGTATVTAEDGEYDVYLVAWNTGGLYNLSEPSPGEVVSHTVDFDQVSEALRETIEAADQNATEAQAKAEQALRDFLAVYGLAQSKGRVYRQPTAPDDAEPGSMWVDTANGNKPYVSVPGDPYGRELLTSGNIAAFTPKDLLPEHITWGGPGLQHTAATLDYVYHNGSVASFPMPPGAYDYSAHFYMPDDSNPQVVEIVTNAGSNPENNLAIRVEKGVGGVTVRRGANTSHYPSLPGFESLPWPGGVFEISSKRRGVALSVEVWLIVGGSRAVKITEFRHEIGSSYAASGWGIRAQGRVDIYNIAISAPSKWVEAEDERLITAVQDAEDALAAATAAQASANGKNSVRYGPAIAEGDTPPTPEGTREGDTYFGRGEGAVITQQWRYDGTQWVQEQIDVEVIANLDAGTVTAWLIESQNFLGRLAAFEEVTAEMVASDVMVVNDVFTRDSMTVGTPSTGTIRMDSRDGFSQTNAGGTPRVSFPLDAAQPNVMQADLITNGLTVLGNSSFRGVNNEISRESVLNIATGTTPPTSVLNSYTWSAWEEIPGVHLPSDALGAHLDTNGDWLAVLPGGLDSSRVTYQRPRLVRVTPTGQTTITTLSNLPNWRYSNRVSGVLRVGSNYVVSVARWNDQHLPDGRWEFYIYVLSTSLGVVRSWKVADSDRSNNAPSTIATDGSSIYGFRVGGLRPDGYGWYVRMERWSLAGTLIEQKNLYEVYATYVGQIEQVLVGNFDYGAPRLVFTYGHVYDMDGVLQSDERFTVPSNWELSGGAGTPRGFGWDGTGFIRFSVNPEYPSLRSSGRTHRQRLRAGYTWHASNPTGTPLETTISPIRDVVLEPRAFGVHLTSPPPPVTYGTPDSADEARLYVGRTDSTLRLQGAMDSGSYVLDNPNLDSGAPPPTTNSFPDGVAGRIATRDPDSYISGDGKVSVRDPLDETDAVNYRFSLAMMTNTVTTLWEAFNPRLEVVEQAAQSSFESINQTRTTSSGTGLTILSDMSTNVLVRSPDEVWEIILVADFESITAMGNTAAVVYFRVNQVNQPKQCLYRGAPGARGTSAQTYRITGLTPGTNLFSVGFALSGNNGAQYRVYEQHTSIIGKRVR